MSTENHHLGEAKKLYKKAVREFQVVCISIHCKLAITALPSGC